MVEKVPTESKGGLRLNPESDHQSGQGWMRMSKVLVEARGTLSWPQGHGTPGMPEGKSEDLSDLKGKACEKKR